MEDIISSLFSFTSCIPFFFIGDGSSVGSYETTREILPKVENKNKDVKKIWKKLFTKKFLESDHSLVVRIEDENLIFGDLIIIRAIPKAIIWASTRHDRTKEIKLSVINEALEKIMDEKFPDSRYSKQEYYIQKRDDIGKLKVRIDPYSAAYRLGGKEITDEGLVEKTTRVIILEIEKEEGKTLKLKTYSQFGLEVVIELFEKIGLEINTTPRRISPNA